MKNKKIFQGGEDNEILSKRKPQLNDHLKINQTCGEQTKFMMKTFRKNLKIKDKDEVYIRNILHRM